MTATKEIHKGRQALLKHQGQLAIDHFQRAAELSPNRLHFFTLPQSAATYLGRAYYEAGQLAAARQTLELARARFEEDKMAQLYLGLTLLRAGETFRGAREISDGAQGMGEWIEYNEGNNIGQGIYWDPAREIRNDIDAVMELVTARNVDAEKLIAAAEGLGNRIEWEIDLARRDEQRSRD